MSSETRIAITVVVALLCGLTMVLTLMLVASVPERECDGRVCIVRGF